MVVAIIRLATLVVTMVFTHTIMAVVPAAEAFVPTLVAFCPAAASNGRCTKSTTRATVATHHSSLLFQRQHTSPLVLTVFKRTATTRLAATLESESSNLDSSDPFVVLGMDTPTSDKKEIKRAYKRMALKYHPDMVTTRDSPVAEKKAASDRFTKINWAYETLSGKRQDAAPGGSNGASKNANGRSSSWEPPHRRSGSSSSSSSDTPGGNSGRSTDWRDYMPKYEQEDAAYDSDGDSFGSIFSDLFAGAAGAAASGGRSGVLRDFVEFLEQNVDGYSASSKSQDDAELKILLQTGSLQQVADEMDDTDLVVQQLSSKLSSLKNELVTLQADLNVATSYSERMDLQEGSDEVKARTTVVEGYLKKARKRLLSLQTRYKELIVGGDNDTKAGGRSRRSRSRTSSSSPSSSSSSASDREPYSAAGYSSSASSSKSDTAPSGASGSSGSSSSESPRTPNGSSSKEDAWKDESFGSFGRGRGSSRSRSRRRTTSASESTTAGPSTSPSGPASGSTSSSRSSTTSRQAAQTPREPPHRRQQTSAPYQDDKQRLRELKVDDEFDKLKKDLGL